MLPCLGWIIPRNEHCTIKGVLYSMLRPDLVGLTVAV